MDSGGSSEDQPTPMSATLSRCGVVGLLALGLVACSVYPPITLRMLMSHHSGLVREPPVGNYFEPLQPELDKAVASLNHTTLVYAPNSRTKYSNAGIAVVGYAYERLQMKPFTKALQENVL